MIFHLLHVSDVAFALGLALVVIRNLFEHPWSDRHDRLSRTLVGGGGVLIVMGVAGHLF